MSQLTRFFLFCLAFISFCGASVKHGYQELLNNDIEAARLTFTEASKGFFDQKKAQGFIGLSLVEAWYGNSDLQAEHCLHAIDLHFSRSTFEPCHQALYLQARNMRQGNKQRLIKVAERAINLWPGEAFSSNLYGEVQNYLKADGDVQKVKENTSSMGFIHDWKMVGPFNNISNSAFYRSSDVESGFDFTEEYDGENGLKLEWKDFRHGSSELWIFLNFYQNVKNSANYFATTLISTRAQNAILSFGVSGSYQIWLNGDLYLESKTFQNSGMDELKVEVPLLKGDNSLLLKLGHTQDKISNFALRLLDQDNKPLILEQSNTPQGRVRSTLGKKQRWHNQWELELLSGVRDNHAQSMVLYMNRLLLKEEFESAIELALKMKTKYSNSAWLYLALNEIYMRRGDKTLAQLYIDKAHRITPSHYKTWRFELERVLAEGNPQKSLSYFQNKPTQIRLNRDLHLKLLSIYHSLNDETSLLSLLDILEQKYSDDSSVLKLLYKIRLRNQNPQRADQILATMKKNFGYHSTTAQVFFDAYLREGKMVEAAQFLEKVISIQTSATGYLEKLSALFFEMKSYDQSIYFANQILIINPWVSSAYELKMKIFEMQGLNDSLDQTFAQYMKINFYDYKMLDRYQELKNISPWSSLTADYDLDSLKKSALLWSERQNANSIFLLNQVSNIVHVGGGFEVYERSLVEILDQKGVDEWKETNINYHGNYEKVKIQKAAVVKPNGQSLSADTQGTKIVFKNLEPGDIIEIKWRRRHFYPGKLAKNFDSKFYLAKSIPVLRYHFETIYPLGTDFKVKQHLNKVKPAQFTHQGREFQVWTLDTVQAYKPENRSVTQDVAWPWIQVSSFPNWMTIKSWYAGLTSSKSEITPELISLADSLFANSKTTEAKIQKVHEFITDKIRYSSVSFRQAGYIPQSAIKSYTTRVGDCKDMSVLAQTLLKIVGVESNLVLVETRDESSAAWLPGLDFNHCILKTPRGYVDFTALHNSWKFLPKMDQGARALVVDKDSNSGLVWLPKSDQKSEYIHRISYDTLKIDGSFVRHVQSIRTGNHAASFRSSLKHEKLDEKRKALIKTLRASFNSAELGAYKWSGVGSNDSTIQYSYDFKAEDAAFINTKTISFPMPWSDKLRTRYLVREKERKFQLEDWDVGVFFGQRKHTMHLKLPEGYHLLDMPQPMRIENKFGFYSSTYTMKGSQLEAQREFWLYPKNVEPEDYSAYRRFMNQVVTSDNGILILLRDNSSALAI